MSRITTALTRLIKRHAAQVAFVLFTAMASVLPAQIPKTLFSFDGTDGRSPLKLIQAVSGEFYGTTNEGGAHAAGTIFKMTPSGALTTLYSFCAQVDCSDGSGPGNLTQGVDGNFYGTAFSGGANNDGTVFKITPDGVLTTLHSFDATDGQAPTGGLVQAFDGDLYGVTSAAGTGCDLFGGCGTVFKITTSGVFTSLHNFTNTDGTEPLAPLIQATDGNLYGTTYIGGAYGSGTVFKMTPGGVLTSIYSFPGGTGGGGVEDGLVQAANGDFYGVAGELLFEITPSGTLTPIYLFCSQTECPDGLTPLGELIQATNGDFYGTTEYGPFNIVECTNGCGTIFEITPSGNLATLYDFCSQGGVGCPGGGIPIAGLIQGTDGTLYGTTSEYGSGDGAIFSLSVALGPFVETRLSAGKIGESVEILGSKLSGATSVSFNGTAAAFTVASESLITTRVPSGATTGNVKVVTPSGTLTSNVPFQVLP